MSHIAEGLLHAHLDGALEPTERERWAAAEEHLTVCEDCRRRLEEAREIRDAATALLAGAAPRAAERPPFDTLVAEAGRRRAEAPEAKRFRDASSRPWWRSPAKLAWAASLVLAVGAGWIGRELLVEESGDVPLLMESRAATEPAGPAERVPPREAEALDEAATTDGGAAVGGTEPGEQGERAEREESARFRAPAPAPGQENDLDDRADASREPSAKTAEPDVILAPQALARRAPEDACYEVEPADGPAGILRLRPDGTAILLGDGRPLVGFWERPSTDSVAARLTDGAAWIELRLGSDERERSARGCPAD